MTDSTANPFRADQWRAVPRFEDLTDITYHRHAGEGRAKTNAYISGGVEDVGADIFARGLCLPSDNKMRPEEQDVIIEVIRWCFE